MRFLNAAVASLHHFGVLVSGNWQTTIAVALGGGCSSHCGGGSCSQSVEGRRITLAMGYARLVSED